jgi:hypothetical protein
MVPDGDFEKSSDGVTGDYSKNEYSNCSNVSSQVPAVGSYVIGNDPSQCIASWDKLEDSNIAMFNGAAAGHRFWCRTFEVEKDTKYAFSVDERLLHRDGGVTSKYGSGLIRWLVDGTVIIPVKSLEQKWVTRGAIVNSETRTAITLCGENTSSNHSGNDFAIDNICMVAQ